MQQLRRVSIALLMGFAPTLAHSAPIGSSPVDVVAERLAPDKVKLSWTGRNGVDVYVAHQRDFNVARAELVSANDRDGQHVITVAPRCEAVLHYPRQKDWR